ncbi:hypothetical protein [Clostridium cylindrosporum]|uniref:Lipoprotein n=1 Tax=Clostridium cylindrosporum DSM 605 TaxID=1121307 RepID=A0A0J8DFB3_CLOCY|nr:hypothetical protein [Clostridium cylindrosporum]KMT22868.1 hypothetical protein CLCY_5c01070 [Clostridium cylindrosporum DSM 605]
MDKKAKGAIAALAAGSAVAGAVFLTKKVNAFLKEGRCKECGKKIDNELFTLYEPENMAYLSRDVVEAKYSEKGMVCPECFDSVYKTEIEAYERAIEGANKVKVYFKDFQGEIDYSQEVKKVSTECYENKEEAIYSIKTMAAYLDCDIIFDLEFATEIINDGKAKKVMYKAKGILAKSY